MYSWEQTLEDVTVVINPPAGVTAKHLAVTLKANAVQVGLKGNPPFLDAKPFATIDVDLSTWTFSEYAL